LIINRKTREIRDGDKRKDWSFQYKKRKFKRVNETFFMMLMKTVFVWDIACKIMMIMKGIVRYFNGVRTR
jgi:hypothetical protein